jgi:hypothetical protein
MLRRRNSDLEKIRASTPLNPSREPFSSPDWIFELKYEGFTPGRV